MKPINTHTSIRVARTTRDQAAATATARGYKVKRGPGGQLAEYFAWLVAEDAKRIERATKRAAVES